MVNINEVILEGVIVHKFVTPKIAILTIGTGNATPTKNFPKVLFFGETITEIEKEYEVGNHIKVTGNIQSSRRKPNVPNQNMVAIFGETIEKSESIMKQTFGVETEKSQYNFKNEIKIAGRLTAIDKRFDNLVRIRISTRKNNRASYVNLAYYTNNPEKIISEFSVGDNVCVVGCVQTTKKEAHGQINHFENYVINEIVKL